MRFRHFRFLLENYQEKLRSKGVADDVIRAVEKMQPADRGKAIAKLISNPSLSLDDLSDTKFKLENQKEHNLVNNADPTPDNSYYRIIAKWAGYTEKDSGPASIILPEDLFRVKEVLEYYNQNKNRFKTKYITKYEEFQDLEQEYLEISGVQTKADAIREIKMKGARKLAEVPGFSLYEITTPEAACYYGKGTRWCTAATENNMAQHYLSRGPLYIFINKKTNEKFQASHDFEDFMDAEDRRIRSDKISDKNADGMIDCLIQTDLILGVMKIFRLYDMSSSDYDKLFKMIDRLDIKYLSSVFYSRSGAVNWAFHDIKSKIIQNDHRYIPHLFNKLAIPLLGEGVLSISSKDAQVIPINKNTEPVIVRYLDAHEKSGNYTKHETAELAVAFVFRPGRNPVPPSIEKFIMLDIGQAARYAIMISKKRLSPEMEEKLVTSAKGSGVYNMYMKQFADAGFTVDYSKIKQMDFVDSLIRNGKRDLNFENWMHAVGVGYKANENKIMLGPYLKYAGFFKVYDKKACDTVIGTMVEFGYGMYYNEYFEGVKDSISSSQISRVLDIVGKTKLQYATADICVLSIDTFKARNKEFERQCDRFDKIYDKLIHSWKTRGESSEDVSFFKYIMVGIIEYYNYFNLKMPDAVVDILVEYTHTVRSTRYSRKEWEGVIRWDQLPSKSIGPLQQYTIKTFKETIHSYVSENFSREIKDYQQRQANS